MGRVWQIAVCEDDEIQLQYINKIIEDWVKKEGVLCRINTFSSGEQFWYSFDEDLPYALYILDIQMGKMSGMELARKIREKDERAVILFLTALREYALEGYEVKALRYLLKPIKEKEFIQLLRECYQAYSIAKEHFFLLERPDGVRKFPYSDIWYLEAEGHYISLFFKDQKIQWKASLGSLQKQFEEQGFVMTRRGLLVNISKITRVGKTECILDNGEKLPVSRGRYIAVNHAFIAYYRENM